MNPMESLGGVFSRLSYFNPLMMINRSETCATTRLLQIRYMGLNMNDITQKFLRDEEYSTDLSHDDFHARRKIVQQIGQANESQHLPWVPVLSTYEIARGSAKKMRDWGHLLFTDATSTVFLLVMIFPVECPCGNADHDYHAITRHHAHKLLCLANYLWPAKAPPKWIRATYTTPTYDYRLDPKFFQTHSKSAEDLTLLNAHPSGRYFHIALEEVQPSLTQSEVQRVDAVLALNPSNNADLPERLAVRQRVVLPAGGKAVVDAELRSNEWSKNLKRGCANCEEVPKNGKLMKCSKCKLVQYCSRKCQANAWPNHKHFCKKAGAE
ncbi:MYND-type domain-containing protein [Mycena chlorophos]|uniref:MYND-type domain-containing protein n=1 Tax=Mycena chlorophos TaxID=658473 RepID=A0A8H6VQI7_MYCCL|nr:MYND-type domain-containing protein [Mycena chlorophos]